MINLDALAVGDGVEPEPTLVAQLGHEPLAVLRKTCHLESEAQLERHACDAQELE